MNFKLIVNQKTDTQTWSDEDMSLVRVDVLKFVQPFVKGFFFISFNTKRTGHTLLASYCSHSLYFVSVDHCCWNLRGAGTSADPDDSFFFWRIFKICSDCFVLVYISGSGFRSFLAEQNMKIYASWFWHVTHHI